MSKTVTSFTFNISGTVTYANNQWADFGVWYGYAGQQATLVGSATAFRSLFTSKGNQITQFLAQLAPATVAFTYPNTGDVSTAIEVLMTGIVAYSDNTIGSFSYDSRSNGTSNNFQGNTDFIALAGDTKGNAEITAAFDAILTPTTVVVTA